jgi:5-methylcytosine-specific restriction protein B
MNSKPEGVGARACWFVGASYSGTDDQTQRFLEEEIWENGYQDKYLDAVRSIQPGDCIESSLRCYTQTRLPKQ